MREILFRGKREDTGEWVYGYYTEACGTYNVGVSVIETKIDDYVVIPETVGQCTGVKDKNGKMIFEGDIVRTRKDSIRNEKLKGYYGVDSDGYPQKIPGYEGESEYHYSCKVECYALVEFSQHSGYYLRGTSTFIDAICNEVVGNIYDNPGLLKGEENGER